jgi:cytochrome c-type biogenesis protein CcmH
MKSYRLVARDLSRTMPTLRVIFFLAVLAACLFFPRRAVAQTPRPVTDDEVNAIAKQLYCPVCENIPLDVCPTDACADWRDEIRLMLSQGKTEAEIKQYFVDRFGDRVIGAPPARGLNWLVYIIPPLAILAGVYILSQAFRSLRRIPPATPAASEALPTPEEDEYVKRLEEELRKR